MKEKLTREQALEFHKQMWSDMKEELGDNPTTYERQAFKATWCIKHDFNDICANCFLCEYDIQHHDYKNVFHCECLIDWKPLTNTNNCCGHTDNGEFIGYENAPISKILELPEREIDELKGDNT